MPARRKKRVMFNLSAQRHYTQNIDGYAPLVEEDVGEMADTATTDNGPPPAVVVTVEDPVPPPRDGTENVASINNSSNSDDEDDECYLPPTGAAEKLLTCEERLTRGRESVRALSKRMMHWARAYFIGFWAWMALLAGAIAVHVRYRVYCEPVDAFGKFCMCLLAYLCFQTGVDFSTAAIIHVYTKRVYRRTVARVVDKVAEMQSVAAHETILERRGEANDAANNGTNNTPGLAFYEAQVYGCNDVVYNKTVEMGSHLRRRRVFQSVVDDHLNGGDAVKVAVVENNKTRANYERPVDRVQRLIGDLRVDEFAFRHGRCTPAPFANWALGIAFYTWTGMKQLSIFPIVFFLSLGVDFTDYTPIDPDSHWCNTSYRYNWAVLGLQIALYVLGVVPIAVRLCICVFCPDDEATLKTSYELNRGFYEQSCRAPTSFSYGGL